MHRHQGAAAQTETSYANVVVQSVPGHRSVEGNELTHTAAKAATLLYEDPPVIPYGCARSLIKQSINNDISNYVMSESVYSKLSSKKDAEIKSRKNQLLLARIWAGHHWVFMSYHKLVDKKLGDRCKVCEDQPTHNIHHFLCKCEQTDTLRLKFFVTTEIGLKSLLKIHPLPYVTPR